MDLFSYIDHTNLKQTATFADIKKLCDEAVKYKMASVCIAPHFVKAAREYSANLNICTVIGFPLGYCTTESKVFEAKDAINNGADEIDMVININEVKAGNFDFITNEISEIKKVCGDKVLKVIIETCYLTDEEKIRLCKCVTEAKADYIKTSTGFGSAGATVSDIELFAKHIGKNIKIKAAGGIKTLEDMQKMIKAGAERIGSSSAIKVCI